MKPFILSILFVFSLNSSFAGNIKNKFSSDERGIKVLNVIKEGHSGLKGMHIVVDNLMSIAKDKQGIPLLIDALDFYIGSGTSFERDEPILEAGKDIIPLLEKKMLTKPLCPKEYVKLCKSKNARDKKIKELIGYINKGIKSL